LRIDHIWEVGAVEAPSTMKMEHQGAKKNAKAPRKILDFWRPPLPLAPWRPLEMLARHPIAIRRTERAPCARGACGNADAPRAPPQIRKNAAAAWTSLSAQLEGLAEDDLGAVVEVGIEVGLGREAEGAGAGVLVEGGAVGAREAQREAAGLVA